MKILEPNGLVDNLYKYVQTNIEIVKVEIQEKIEDTIKKAALIAILTITGTLFFNFSIDNLVLISERNFRKSIPWIFDYYGNFRYFLRISLHENKSTFRTAEYS